MDIKGMEQGNQEKMTEDVIDVNIKLFKDGDSYCALLGKDLQSGIGRFAEKPIDAIRNLCDSLEYIVDDNNDNIHIIGEY